MTEKSGVAYPPLSDEDLARYGGPPELEYLPLVSMANELIAARALMKTGPLVRERAAVDRLKESIANEARLRAEVERLTADLVAVEAKRKRAWAAATGEQQLHAETHRQLAQIEADHNALLLHLHAIREAAGIPLGDWGVQAGDWGSVASTISERLRDKAALLGRLEALCHRLEDNDVPVTAETPTWIGHLEAGITKLIEQRDGACSRREAEETARIKADAEAVFEAQRADLATALGMTGDWNTLVRGAVQLRRLHAELTTELISIDRALEGGPQYGAADRAMRVRDCLNLAADRRVQIQDATQKLCKALGIADTATLGFAVETAVGLIGDTPRREPLLERRLIAGGPKLAAQGDLARRIRASKYIQHLDSIQGDHDWLREATDGELLDAVFARVDAADRLEAELDAVRQQIEEARPLMPVSPARAELLREQDDRIKALEEHNQEMHESVAMALGHERGGAGVGWKDLILEIGSHRASRDEAKRAKSRVAVALGYKADDQSHWDGFVSAIERAVMERQGTFETMKRCTDRLAKIAHACGVDTAVETPWIENISDRIVAAIERQGADLREARQNAEAALARVADRDGQLNAFRISLNEAASAARLLSDRLDDIEHSL